MSKTSKFIIHILVVLVITLITAGILNEASYTYSDPGARFGEVKPNLYLSVAVKFLVATCLISPLIALKSLRFARKWLVAHILFIIISGLLFFGLQSLFT